MTKYQHRQFGTTLVVTLGISAAAILVLTELTSAYFLGRAVAGLFLVAAMLFSSLTIEITNEQLRWKFGLGLIRKQVPLSDICGAAVTRTRFLEGWGIHLTTRGWLYNVSGFDAVIVRVKTGKQFLLGTDEPKRLASILAEQVA